MTDNLEGLRAALKRGTKRSRLRLAVVVCPKGHTLIEMFRGDDGATVGLAATRSIYTRGRGTDWFQPFGPSGGHVVSNCRCPNPDGLVTSDTAWRVPIEWVYAAMKAGATRIRADDAWRSRSRVSLPSDRFGQR